MKRAVFSCGTPGSTRSGDLIWPAIPYSLTSSDSDSGGRINCRICPQPSTSEKTRGEDCNPPLPFSSVCFRGFRYPSKFTQKIQFTKHDHNTRQKLKWPISVIPSVAEGYSMSRLIAISLHSRCSVEMTFLFFVVYYDSFVFLSFLQIWNIFDCNLNPPCPIDGQDVAPCTWYILFPHIERAIYQWRSADAVKLIFRLPAYLFLSCTFIRHFGGGLATYLFSSLLWNISSWQTAQRPYPS